MDNALDLNGGQRAWLILCLVLSVLVILVQIITMLGSYFTRKFDHRIR